MWLDTRLGSHGYLGVDSSGEGAQFWIRGLSFHPEDMLRPGNRGGAQTDPGTFDQEE